MVEVPGPGTVSLSLPPHLEAEANTYVMHPPPPAHRPSGLLYRKLFYYDGVVFCRQETPCHAAQW